MLDVVGQDDGSAKEKGSSNQGMSGREAGFARTIWACIQNKNILENDIGDGHQSIRHDECQKSFVDFFERFAFIPLSDTHHKKDDGGGNGSGDHDICCFIPIHNLIIAQKGPLLWCIIKCMETVENKNAEKEQRIFRKTFGQKVAEVFEREGDTENLDTKYKEYIEKVREERALLETLNFEQTVFQDYIFRKAINDNPEASRFIKNIPGLDTHRPLIKQLSEKNEDGSYKIPDETVANVLEFYQSVLKEKEAEFAGEFEEILSSYESGLEDKVAKGKLPKTLLENYEKIKEKSGGSILSEVRLFDLRPRVEGKEAQYEPPSAVSYIEHHGLDNKGNVANSEDTEKVFYRRFFVTPQQKETLGSMENMMDHELTHIIAGTEASFRLLPSESGSADLPFYLMSTEGQITMAYREGMTEAIGQMVADSSPEADSYSLRHYLRNKTGTYPAEREFLARLMDIDERCRNGDQNSDGQEPLENLFLETYAETDGDKYINKLRERLYYIFNNWESVVREEDFPETLNFEFDFLIGRNEYEGREKEGWQEAFDIFLNNIRTKYTYQGR